MKANLLTAILPLLLLAGSSGASSKPKTPKAPGLTYLYQLNITGGAGVDVGVGPRGDRFVVPIASGSFLGPRLNGMYGVCTVLPFGGDWALIDNKGVVVADVRQTFATDDGAYIQVYETGSSQPDGTSFVRLTFETGSPKYYWLNSVVAIGILRLVTNSSLSIDAWQVSLFRFLMPADEPGTMTPG
ncbi:hypothetical protein B0T17DRAFT_626699 [Bombardia bombarda]|uniref:Uncharacterized protein n=1 Tax=Bombardia bombarda TaxID=252184 RepID=A0AA40CFE6_9PEZI|nr:hypothetical protein B0T17DRAFT_626699 [Bombardia bombarda]